MMSITFNETTYHIQASSQEMFESEVRRLLCLPPDSDLDVTFECRFPGQAGAKLELHGLHTYDTAVFCASAAVATGHLAATSSSSSSSEGASHCSCGDGSSNGMHGGSSDGSSSVWWWSDDDGDDDDGSEERGLLLFSNAISAQLAECADGAVGVVTGALGSMLTRMLA